MRSAMVGMTLMVACFHGVTLGQATQREERQQKAGQQATGQPVTGQQAAGQQAAGQQAAGQQAAGQQAAGQQGRVGQPAQPGRTAAPDAGRQPGLAVDAGRASGTDQQLAAFIYGGCHNHIEIAKFAEAKLQTPEAKQFAEKMVREHTPGCEAMKRLAGNLAAGDHATGGQQPAQPGTAVRPGSEAVARGGAGGTLDWLSFHKQLGEQCLESTKRELTAHSGADFDKAFIHQQCVAHTQSIDSLEVALHHASGELKQNIEKALQMAKGHLQEAKQIKEQMKDQPAERVTRKPK